jgi:antitoxin ParD1/3/4
MQENIHINIGKHFGHFLDQKISEGRYNSADDVVLAGLRLLEEQEVKIYALRKALIEGEESGIVEYDFEALLKEIDEE